GATHWWNGRGLTSCGGPRPRVVKCKRVPAIGSIFDVTDFASPTNTGIVGVFTRPTCGALGPYRFTFSSPSRPRSPASTIGPYMTAIVLGSSGIAWVWSVIGRRTSMRSPVVQERSIVAYEPRDAVVASGLP